MEYKNFKDIIEASSRNLHTKTVAVAGAADSHVLAAVIEAEKRGLIKPVLIGRRIDIEKELKALGEDVSKYEIIGAEDNTACGVKAVELVKSGDAEFIMKGMVETKDVLKPLVNRENGLNTGRTMNIFSYNEVPQMSKLMAISDAGMIPYPTLAQKKDIILNCVESFHKLGVENPSVAVLAAAENVNPKIIETTDAVALVEMNKNGEIPGCEVFGPLSFDIMMSREIAEIKNFDCRYSGNFDCVIVPNMVAGNLMNKAMILCGGAKMAGVVVGARVPVVLSSRGASAEEKFVSIALASLIS